MFLQHLIGIVVFCGVLCFAIWMAYEKNKDITDNRKEFFSPILFLIAFFGAYAGLGVVCGIFWCIAWIGIFIRSVFQWLLEAIFYVPMLLI